MGMRAQGHERTVWGCARSQPLAQLCSPGDLRLDPRAPCVCGVVTASRSTAQVGAAAVRTLSGKVRGHAPCPVKMQSL